MPAQPARVCPLCGHQDGLRPPEPLPEGGWLFVCEAHTPVYVFETTSDDNLTKYPGGLANDLGLYEDLPACLVEGEPWVEYGIVEFRYATAHPDEYTAIVERFSHVAIAPTRYSASSFLAGVLGRLNTWGVVTAMYGQSTGRWSYNARISYWSTLPAPPATRTLSWTTWAADHGIDPAAWPVLPHP